MTPKKVFYSMLVLVLIVVAASAYIFVIFRDELRQDIHSITEKKLEVELADGELRQLRETSEEYAQYSYLREELTNILPADKEQSEAISRLISLFNKAGVPVAGLSFLGTDGAPTNESQTVDTGINGVAALPIEVAVPDPIPYEKAVRLLKVLEGSERHLNVDTFALASTSDNELPDGYVNITVKVEMQLKAEPTAAQTTESGGAL